MAHVKTESVPWILALADMIDEFPGKVAGVRGLGFLVGVQVNGDATAIHTALREAGLLTALAGGGTIRLLPPLNATRAQLNRSVEIFRSVLAKAA